MDYSDVTSEITIYLVRVGEVLRRLTDTESFPPLVHIHHWLVDPESDALLKWVSRNSSLAWAVAITQIEAALAIADEPREGGLRPAALAPTNDEPDRRGRSVAATPTPSRRRRIR